MDLPNGATVKVIDTSGGRASMANALATIAPLMFDSSKDVIVALMSILRIFVSIYRHHMKDEGETIKSVDDVFKELWTASDELMNEMLADKKNPERAASNVAVPSPTGAPLSKSALDKMFASLKDKLAS